MRKLLSCLSLTIALAAYGQGDGVVREASYRPEGRSFVTVNGTNRYTRAIYGGTSEYRIETSDRPVFAIYKKNLTRNISFRLTYRGATVSLDSTLYCKAAYEGGRRDYILRDKRWGDGTLRVSVLAYNDAEGGIWKFSAEGFSGDVLISCRMTRTRAAKFVRSGDMGRFELPGCFEAHDRDGQQADITAAIAMPRDRRKDATTGVTFVSVDSITLSAPASRREWQTMAQRYEKAERQRAALAGSVTFNTPDAYLNPVGGALCAAADGAWGGKVWMHGAVGWRMPLPGWRAAYMGDFLGMPDRQRIHFDAYAKSMVTDVPVTEPHLMDETNNLARGAYKWGTPMYSNGYICRNPERNDQFHHYDMNLVYIDELLWHLQFDADTVYMRKMWPVLKRHLAWEKQAWDPDNDSLYDAYCCIWASDALQYNSGAATHASAYNYRANALAARIADILGEDSAPYREEAQRILDAMNRRLWVSEGTNGPAHWAEYQDFMGYKRVHPNAAVWSIYTPIDCGAGSPRQAYDATRYIDSRIPHLPFVFDGEHYATISTSSWAPYEWSINNVAMAEVMHTALAYYKAGRTEEAYRLLKANVLDFMYLGSSPANFGQLSQLDRATGEAYRDFADVTGISSRTFIEGLYGITPEALEGRCIIRPGFPSAWEEASIHTPYLDYAYTRRDGKVTLDVRQRFRRPLAIVVRQNKGMGEYIDTVCSADSVQHIVLDDIRHAEDAPATAYAMPEAMGNGFGSVDGSKLEQVDMTSSLNAAVSDVFKQEYLSPRSPYTTLCVPKQGIGDWCSTKRTAEIDASGIRGRSIILPASDSASEPKDGVIEPQGSAKVLQGGVKLFGIGSGKNDIAFTSLWDNYPDSIVIPLYGSASHAYILMAGTTNPMQYDIANGRLTAEYADGSRDTLSLTPPYNWCPIEQDYLDGAAAFPMPEPRPLRVGLKSGIVSRYLSRDMGGVETVTASDIPQQKTAMLNIDGGAGIIIDMPLNPGKRLRSISLTTLSNEVVMGIMAITLQRESISKPQKSHKRR